MPASGGRPPRPPLRADPALLARTLLACACIASPAALGCTPSPDEAPPSRAPATWPVTIAPPASAAPALDAGPGDAGADASPPSDAGRPVAAADDPETVEARRLAQGVLQEYGPPAYSPSTGTFIYVLSHTEEGNGTGLTFFMARAGEEKPFETLPICKAGECAYDFAPWFEDFTPKVVERVKGKGYVLLTSTRWPEHKGQMTLASPPLTLRWQRDRLVATRAGKPPVTLPPVKFAPQHKATPSAVAVVPDGTWIVVEIDFDPGSHYAQGFNNYSEVHTYRLP
jgi:hypothetical protein